MERRYVRSGRGVPLQSTNRKNGATSAADEPENWTREEVESLLRVSHAASRPGELDELLNFLAEEARGTTRSDSASILLNDPRGGFAPAASCGLSNDYTRFLQSDFIRFGPSGARLTVEQAKPLAIEDVMSTHNRPKLEPYTAEGGRPPHLFLIVRMIQLLEGKLQSEQISMFIGREIVVTILLSRAPPCSGCGCSTRAQPFGSPSGQSSAQSIAPAGPWNTLFFGFTALNSPANMIQTGMSNSRRRLAARRGELAIPRRRPRQWRTRIKS